MQPTPDGQATCQGEGERGMRDEGGNHQHAPEVQGDPRVLQWKEERVRAGTRGKWGGGARREDECWAVRTADQASRFGGRQQADHDDS